MSRKLGWVLLFLFTGPFGIAYWALTRWADRNADNAIAALPEESQEALRRRVEEIRGSGPLHIQERDH